jgi:tripartite-type tricarboxylate transporter receptor subunit TctC
METEVNLSKRRLAAFAMLGCLLSAGAKALETNALYPCRRVILTVGYPPGGGADTLARLLAEHLADELKQDVVVQNRPGAASNIAAESVAHAKPDGYTLYISTRSNTIHKSMYGHFDFDVMSDLSPIGVLAKVPNVILTGIGSPISTIADVIALAKMNPGGVTYASTGVGSDTHLLGELFQQHTGVQLLHVPYRGGAAAMADVVSGRVDLLIFSLPGALPYINAATARPIALMSRTRVPAVENVPTMEESGVRDVNLETWFGLMAPGGTPTSVIGRLNRAVNTVLAKPGMRDALSARGYVVPARAGEALPS